MFWPPGKPAVPLTPAGMAAPRKLDQIGSLAAVERQIENALILDHRADAGVLRFHLRRIGFHLHCLRNRADVQSHVDGRIGGHLKHDAGLDIVGEARLGDFQAIRPDGQVRENVIAIRP